MSKNKSAIKAARKIAAPFISSVEDHDRVVVYRQALYAIVQDEHKEQIDSIHVPEKVHPQKLTLNRKERLFLWYLNGKRTDIENVGVYWYIEYQLYDYQACVQKLFDGGYLQCARPSDSLEVLKLEDLKSILKEAKLPSSGTKTKLCARIRDALSDEYINDRYPHFQTFSCTDQGNRIIQESAATIYLHQHKMNLPVHLDFRDVEKMARKYPQLSGKEIVGALVASRDKKAFINGFASLSEDEKKDVFERVKKRLKK